MLQKRRDREKQRERGMKKKVFVEKRRKERQRDREQNRKETEKRDQLEGVRELQFERRRGCEGVGFFVAIYTINLISYEMIS
jgi:hypothetical protein